MVLFCEAAASELGPVNLSTGMSWLIRNDSLGDTAVTSRRAVMTASAGGGRGGKPGTTLFYVEFAHELTVAATRQVSHIRAGMSRARIPTELRQTMKPRLTIRCKERSNSKLDGRSRISESALRNLWANH